jgi:hypothetical protein
VLNVFPLVQRNEQKTHFLKLCVTFLLHRKQVLFEFHLAFRIRAFRITLQRQATLSYYSVWESAISADFSNAVSNSSTEVQRVMFGDFVSYLNSGLTWATNVFGNGTWIVAFLSCGYFIAQWDPSNTSTFFAHHTSFLNVYYDACAYRYLFSFFNVSEFLSAPVLLVGRVAQSV